MLSITAYARTDDDDEDIDLSEILIPIPIVVTSEPGAEPQPLTPDGNLSLVDDSFVTSIGEKQFITIETKNGNFFYIFIDRTGHKENVHFLNLVDELDLLALLDDDVELPERDQSEPYIPASLQETEDELEPEADNGNSGNFIAIIVFLLIAAGGAGFYFKVIKPKQAVNSGGNLMSLDELDGDDDENEFDGGEDEDDYVNTETEPENETIDIDESSEKEYEDEEDYI
jgi:hypothetical protein